MAAIFVFGIAGGGQSEEAAPKARAARLEVPEVSFDFGYAPQDAKISHIYWIKNVGDDTLRITDVRPGCGCTKAPLRKKVVSPGDSADVEVIFSTGKYSGKTQKSATITANVTGVTPALTFTASPLASPDSLRVFSLTPPRLKLDSVPAGELRNSWSREVTVRNTSESEIEFRLISTPDNFVEIEVPGGPLAPGAEALIKVKVSPAAADTVFTKSFTLEATDAKKTRYTFPIQRSAPVNAQASSTH